MTYFNPRIYNYSNLKAADKDLIDFALTVLEAEAEIDFGDFESEALEKFAEKVESSLIEGQLMNIMDHIVGIIDGYGEAVEEKDTNDFFFGCELIKHFRN